MDYFNRTDVIEQPITNGDADINVPSNRTPDAYITVDAEDEYESIMIDSQVSQSGHYSHLSYVQYQAETLWTA